MRKKITKYAVRLLCVLICGVIVFVTVKSVQTKKSTLGEKGMIDYPKGLTELSISEAALLENEKLALYVDESYSIRLLDKATGKTWSSALSDTAQQYFNVSADAAVSSCQIEFLSGDNTVTPYNSYIQSVMKEQSRLYKTDNGIRLTYIFGERTGDDIIPQALTEKRYKEIYSKLTDTQKDFIKRRYQLFSADTMTEADNPDEKYETFSKLKDTPLYIISDVSGKVIIKKTKELFEDIGYTREDYEKDNELTGFAGAAKECTFKISYDLKLEDNDLLVTLPVSEIGFYDEFPMLTVTPLQFFTSSYNNSGEIIVPVGSGSLMNFKNGSAKASFSAPFYGEDSTKEFEEIPPLMLTGHDNSLTMPVYFFTEGNNTVMTVIESGAEAASLNIERDVNSVYAYTSFDVVQNGYSYLTTKKKTLICGSDSIGNDIVLRYRFISNGGYVKAANEFKEYLLENELLKANKLSENPLTLIESVGAVKNNGGELLTLSTLKDIKEMAKEVSNNGSFRISAKLGGINKGGLYKQVPGEFKLNKELGSENDLSEIESFTEKSGGKAYINLNHLYYYNHTSFDGFSVKKNTAKIIDKSWAVLGGFDPVEGTYGTSKGKAWVISPKAYKNTAEGYMGRELNSIGIGDFAATLNSDYNAKSYYDRSDALKKVTDVLKLYEKSNAFIAAKAANAYALKFVDLIENMPSIGSKSTIFEKNIPFTQICLHGNIEYTSEPVNCTANPEDTLLAAIETGAGIHLSLNKNISFDLFKTENTVLYSTSYEANSSLAKTAVEKVNAALKGLNSLAITSHSKENNVSVTTYADGTRIYVNYNTVPVNKDGVEIPARDFVRK